MAEQMSIFDMLRQPFKIDKPIRMVELFSGYGSQSMAMTRLNANIECYRAIEIDKYAMASFNICHGTNFETTDICEVKGGDLGITDKSDYTYVLTYSFP